MSEILSAIRLKDKVTIVTVMAAIAVLLATLVGVLTYVTADRHTHVYDYSLVRGEDGDFEVLGVCRVNNCEKPYFHQEITSGVNLLSAKSPTCSEEGNKIYTYTYSGLTLKYTEILPKSAHLYEYKVGSDGGTFYINGKCMVEGCTDPFFFKDKIEDLVLVNVVEATCFSPREETYSYVSNGVTETFVTLVDVEIPHTLQGVAANTLANDKGEYIYGTEGITSLATEFVPCGGLDSGYFVCEVCRKIEVVQLRYPDHKFVYNEETLVEPTLERDGKTVLSCSNAGCNETYELVIPKVEVGVNTIVKKPATELYSEVVTYIYESEEYGFSVELDFTVGDPLTHNYVYKLVLKKNEEGLIDTDHIDLVGICSQPDCQTPEVREENVETTFEDTSTCVSAGKYIWTHVKDGQVITLTIISTEPGKHKYAFDDSDKKNFQKPTLDEAGWAKIKCIAEGCESTIVVELPKVEIGVNATVESEGEGYMVLAYEFVTNYNCTVKLKIFIE